MSTAVGKDTRRGREREHEGGGQGGKGKGRGMEKEKEKEGGEGEGVRESEWLDQRRDLCAATHLPTLTCCSHVFHCLQYSPLHTCTCTYVIPLYRLVHTCTVHVFVYTF